MSFSKIFKTQQNDSYVYQGNFYTPEIGPHLLVARSHLMLIKIRQKRLRYQSMLSEDTNSEKSLSFNEYFPEMSIFQSDHVKSYSEGWNCTNQRKKSNLYELIWTTIERHEKPDMLIKIGNVVFRCYSSLLYCYTKYFTEFKQQKHVELRHSKITATAFMKLCNWMLQDNVTITQQNVLHLLGAAEVLKIQELRNQCWTVLDNPSIYAESVAYELYCGAKQNGLVSLQQLMLPRIWKFFLTLLASEDFLKMDTDEVCNWLHANSIGVNSEMEVFYGAVLWVNSKWNERKGKPLRKVMSCIRYGLIPPWFLVSLHTASHGHDVDRIVRNSKVKKLIADGLSLTTAMLFYSKDLEEFDEFLRRGNLKIPMQRKWLIDTSCPYHYCENSLEFKHICYESFVEYLYSLKKRQKSHWHELKSASENHWNFMCSLRPNSLIFNIK